MVIANGTSSDYVIRQVLDGRKVGTFFTMVDEAGPSVEYQAAEGMTCLSVSQYGNKAKAVVFALQYCLQYLTSLHVLVFTC